ncbi:PREDICTED: SH3 domain-binding protein 5-like [Priapulus caudatus]|uniref:SH3 domain-binding protein 5-like n=1 Tax=Priapulus caudatus TaxID=37621 RepID=A0ABM1E3L9_PRICU|nr:PREDICTED: SH3 domain-binding protein 5-like [Priapulus caudatus]
MAAVENELDKIDPRIQGELERLNSATTEINRLEKEVDAANSVFRTTLSESSQQLKQLAKKLGKSVEKARPYYEARDVAFKAHREAQKAAIQFQRANSEHQAAKETIYLAEQRLLNMNDKRVFDSAWQEMINHATMKLNEAESAKLKNESDHQEKSAQFVTAEQRLYKLEKELRSAINKSRNYFERKDKFQAFLQDKKRSIEGLQRTVQTTKRQYADALNNLEQISEEIHSQRLQDKQREPGVGAEEAKDRTSPVPDLDNLRAKASLMEGSTASLPDAELDDITVSSLRTDASDRGALSDCDLSDDEADLRPTSEREGGATVPRSSCARVDATTCCDSGVGTDAEGAPPPAETNTLPRCRSATAMSGATAAAAVARTNTGETRARRVTVGAAAAPPVSRGAREQMLASLPLLAGLSEQLSRDWPMVRRWSGDDDSGEARGFGVRRQPSGASLKTQNRRHANKQQQQQQQ